MPNVDVYNLVVTALAVVFSLTIHELAHARTALAFGDPTAKNMGRVTLNPLAHLDPIGTIAMLLSTMAGAGIGWAKPVPVNPANLHPARLGNAMVSLAGPLSNFALAVVAAGFVRLMVHLNVWVAPFGGPSDLPVHFHVLSNLLFVLVICNISLGLFNLIPLFPLDGHHIQREILPRHSQAEFMRWQVKYGPIVLLAIIFLPPLLGNVIPLLKVLSPLSFLRDHVIFPAVIFLVSRQALV